MTRGSFCSEQKQLRLPPAQPKLCPHRDNHFLKISRYFLLKRQEAWICPILQGTEQAYFLSVHQEQAPSCPSEPEGLNAWGWLVPYKAMVGVAPARTGGSHAPLQTQNWRLSA